MEIPKEYDERLGSNYAADVVCIVLKCQQSIQVSRHATGAFTTSMNNKINKCFILEPCEEWLRRV